MPRYFHERGRTHEDVLERIRRKYGDRARILMHKTVPGTGIQGLLGREFVEYSGYVTVGDEAREAERNRDRETREAILAAAGKPSVPPPMPTSADPAGSGDAGLDDVLKELRELKGSLVLSASPPPEPFPHLAELRVILKDNDFDESFIDEILDDLRRRHSAADLDDRSTVHESAAAAIAGRLRFYRHEDERRRVVILVGPTGVGKTTTIAKLAAVHGLGSGGRTVRIITVDSFRIGAKAQVETYGEIMGIPVSAVDDYEDLRTQVALAEDSELLLVDTIGKSPRDEAKIDEMRALLAGCGDAAEVHLAVSATTKTADLRDIMKQFESFDYRSVVLTKLDETSRIGNLISVFATAEVPFSYLTDGQSVPVDISVASPARIMERVKGLDYDRSLMAERHPAADLTAAWR